MRDTHRLKEKFELSLDGRQIVTLTVAAIVVLGGVFVLGVVVGKKLALEAAQAQARPTDLLTALDQKAAAQADASLTFQDELTKKAEPPPAEAPKLVAAVKPAEALKPAEAAKPAEPPRPAGAASAGAADAAVGPAALAAAEQPADATRPPEAVKLEPVATRTHDAGGLKEAIGKAQKAPETAADGAWTIQLSAYQDRSEAERFAAGLRDKGYAPYVVEADIPGKGVWHRVRMGRFATKDAASRFMDDFKRETAMPAIVTTAK